LANSAEIPCSTSLVEVEGSGAATVAKTELLFRWLRSLGPDVEIVKPVSLRRRMQREVADLASRYRRRGKGK